MNSSDGIIWNPRAEIFNESLDGFLLYGLCVGEHNGTYWLVGHYPSGGGGDIFFSISTDGINWDSPLKVTINASDDTTPSMIIDSNGTLWIAWQTDRWGNSNISVTNSTVTLTSPLGGETWSGLQNISWASISGDYINDSFFLYYSNDSINWTLIESGIPATGPYTNNSASPYQWNTANVPDGTYKIKIVRTNSFSGHNETDVSDNFTIDNPPLPVTNLTNTTGVTWINWTWENPGGDFNYTIVYINGVWKTNTSDNFFNLIGLEGSTTWEISLRTIDLAGNINLTWVNQTATTLPYPPPSIVSFSPLTNPSDDEGTSRTFTITSDQVVNVSWQVNGTEVQTNISVTSASYTSLAIEGCWNVSAIITNANGSNIKTWIWTVNPVIVCGDGICEGETCSSCPQDCGACPVSVSVRGGGVSYPIPTPLIITDEYIISTQFLLSIKAGERASLKFERTDITEIEVETSQTSIFVEISVLKPIDPHKTDVPSVSGILYTYQEIKTKNLEIESAKIKFKVNKSWMNENEVNSESIKMKRYDESWISLPTFKIGEDESSFFYEALTEKLSVFAITGEVVEVEVEEKVKIEEAPEIKLPSPPLPAETQIPPTPISTPAPTEKPIPGFEVLFAIAGLLIIAYLSGKRKQLHFYWIETK